VIVFTQDPSFFGEEETRKGELRRDRELRYRTDMISLGRALLKRLIEKFAQENFRWGVDFTPKVLGCNTVT